MESDLGFNGNFDVFLGTVSPFYISLVSGLIILVVGIILGRVIGIILDKFFREIDFDSAINVFSRRTYSFGSALSDIVSFVIYFISVIYAFNVFGILSFAIKFLLVVFGLVLGGSLLLNAFEFFPNFIAGILIRKRRLIKSNEELCLLGVKGKVLSVGLLRIRLLSKSFEDVFISNIVAFHELKK
ncbi:hypothetical protein K9L97_04450 [Candidatus Woesearchaeota archaeon]|nr:hypothetical protein [Candidatus Woesearchaeota archaeon]